MTSDHDKLLTYRALAGSAAEELIAVVLSGRSGTSERVEAAEILGYRRCSQAIPALLGMLREGWHTDSVSAAEALAKIGDLTAVPHLEQVYEECKAICAGAHLHWDANRLQGVLGALLRFRSEPDLKLLLQQGDRLEGLLAGRELEKRRATRRLRQFLLQRQGMTQAVIALHRSGEVQGWTIPCAVEATTGLPHEEARYLVVCALRERNDAE